MSVDFVAETSGNLVLLYPESDRAETYAENLLVDEDHQACEWSDGIPFTRGEYLSLSDQLADLGFSVEENA